MIHRDCDRFVYYVVDSLIRVIVGVDSGGVEHSCVCIDGIVLQACHSEEPG